MPGLEISTTFTPGRVNAYYSLDGRKGYAGFLEYSRRDAATLAVDYVQVGGQGEASQLWLRGQGVQSRLFERLLREFPRTRRIAGYTLAEVNEEALYASLMRALDASPGFVRAEPGVEALARIRAEVAGGTAREFSAHYVEELDRIRREDPRRYQALLRHALEEVPGYRTQVRNGFSLCGDVRGSIFEPSGSAFGGLSGSVPAYRLLTVVYDVCR